MGSKGLSALEKDAIGEILNISLGASATAVSNMLSARVDITTPKVQVQNKDNFDFSSVEPAVGVEITYVEGIEGSNIMLLKRHDVKVIVEMLMGMEIPEEEFELNELNISAICEVMNQMMGASATALSEFFNKPINISTPVSQEVQTRQAFIDKYFEGPAEKVVISFNLKIEDKLQSEFLNVMSLELAKSLVKDLLPPSDDEEEDTDAETSDTPAGATAAAEPPLEEAPAAPAGAQPEMPQMEAPSPEMQSGVQTAPPEMPQMSGQPVMPQPDMGGQIPYADYGMQQGMAPMNPMMMQMQQQMLAQMMEMQKAQQQFMEQMAKPKEKEKAAPKTINVRPVAGSEYKNEAGEASIQEENQELIMGVPLEISVEIGRTRKLVKEILEFTQGSLVVLDKLAGEQADIFVNGRRIAKGDVVVVEDSFGVRITEIVDASDAED